jgi:AcrR family transcriptional regulator
MKSRDLREECIEAAFALVEEQGAEKLSIREVARRVGVSHQAPYKHFASAEHLLAELVRRTYLEFAGHLEARPQTGAHAEDMRSLGVAYVAYARKYPMRYRLMFGTVLPNPQAHPETMAAARRAFGILLRFVGGDSMDALFVWAAVHGLATIQETSVMEQLGMKAKERTQALPHVLRRIGAAMGVREV